MVESGEKEISPITGPGKPNSALFWPVSVFHIKSVPAGSVLAVIRRPSGLISMAVITCLLLDGIGYSGISNFLIS